MDYKDLTEFSSFKYLDITYREYKEFDLRKISDFFEFYEYGCKKEKWLRWKYLKNPEGKGRIFLAENERNNIMGLVGYIPRKINTKNDNSIDVMESVDLFIAPNARGKKIGFNLLKFALHHINKPIIAFPNKISQKLSINCGFINIAPLDRWHFFIESQKREEKSFLSYFTFCIKILYRLYASICLFGRFRKIEMRPIDKIVHEFSAMNRQFRIKRKPDLINWRFTNNPIENYLLFEFWNSHKIIGHCAFKLNNNTLELYEFYALSFQKSCFKKIIKFCNRKGISKIIFSGVGHSLWKFGFIKSFSNVNLIGYNLSPKEPYILTLTDSDW